MFLPVICSGRLGVRNMTWILESSLIFLGFLLLVGPFGLDLRGHIVCTTAVLSPPHSLYFCHLHFVSIFMSCCDPFCFLFSCLLMLWPLSSLPVYSSSISGQFSSVRVQHV